MLFVIPLWKLKGVELNEQATVINWSMQYGHSVEVHHPTLMLRVVSLVTHSGYLQWHISHTCAR
jgi:hypothetical protein